jgi:hypothetical protein
MIMKLTPIKESQDLMDDVYAMDTVSLIEYGLRDGCIDSEYQLALRLQEMRKITFSLLEHLEAEGFTPGNATLGMVDVQREVVTSKRFKCTP